MAGHWFHLSVTTAFQIFRYTRFPKRNLSKVAFLLEKGVGFVWGAPQKMARLKLRFVWGRVYWLPIVNSQEIQALFENNNKYC